MFLRTSLLHRTMPPHLRWPQELKEEDAARNMELAAYFTHCSLQPTHTALSLRNAMTIFFKAKNFATCAHFCRRCGPRFPACARYCAPWEELGRGR